MSSPVDNVPTANPSESGNQQPVNKKDGCDQNSTSQNDEWFSPQDLVPSLYYPYFTKDPKKKSNQPESNTLRSYRNTSKPISNYTAPIFDDEMSSNPTLKQIITQYPRMPRYYSGNNKFERSYRLLNHFYKQNYNKLRLLLRIDERLRRCKTVNGHVLIPHEVCNDLVTVINYCLSVKPPDVNCCGTVNKPTENKIPLIIKKERLVPLQQNQQSTSKHCHDKKVILECKPIKLEPSDKIKNTREVIKNDITNIRNDKKVTLESNAIKRGPVETIKIETIKPDTIHTSKIESIKSDITDTSKIKIIKPYIIVTRKIETIKPDNNETSKIITIKPESIDTSKIESSSEMIKNDTKQKDDTSSMDTWAPSSDDETRMQVLFDTHFC